MSRPPKRYSAARSGAGAIVPVSPNATLPAELSGEIASTRDGRDITRPWIGELEEFRDRRLLGALDWGVYDKILLDDQVKSDLQQRRSAITSREWSMASGKPGDPRADKAATALEENLMRLSWTRKTGLMLRASFYGISVAEMMWEHRDGLYQFGACKVRHARRFRYDKDGKLRLITPRNMRGDILPERKFWVATSGADDDDQPYGRGLAEWLYWPTLFKRNGIRFWNIFLDKFSVPPVKGSYPRGTSKEEIEKLLQSMMALANDSGIAVPEGVVLDFMQVATNGIDFEKMPEFMNDSITRIILSQTMTTKASASGLGSGQADVQAGVKQEVVIEDADMLSDSFTEGPARWFTDYNFGTDVAAPVLTYLVEQESDTKSTAETDVVLARTGWVRTEESFKDIYGDGFERKAAAPAPPAPPGQKQPPRAANDADTDAQPAKVVSFAEPRPLYVYRRVRNTKPILDWARAQGFKSAVPSKELHVTIAYSRSAVDWFELGQAWSDQDGGLTVPPGGPRQVEQLGKGAVVLRFASDSLEWRNQDIRERGASWDNPEYRPHITFTYDGAGVDLAAVEPYQGELLFGPEIFEPIDAGWENDLREVSFAEPDQGDVVDQAVLQIMADEGWRTVADNLGITALIAELGKAGSEEEVDAILKREALRGDQSAFVEQLERAGFAVKMTATVGEDEA